MLTFFSENLATILICAGLAALVACIVWSLVRQKKAGKGCNCGGCSGCAGASICHAQKKPDPRGKS